MKGDVHTFGSLIDDGTLSVTDGYRAKNSELGGDGLLFLRAGHVTDTHIDFEGVDRFDDALAPKLADKTSRPGDVAVTTKGNSTGRTTFVTEDMPPFVYSPHLSRWRSLDHDILCPGFLRYWSRGREFVEQLHGMMVSTDMAPYLSMRDQRLLRITLPTIDEQRAIASVLGSLDDKIELNRRMNRTLEQMAAAIFKAWFVDFEPVRAKASGAASFPGMPQPVFDALPATFADSELGPTPEGWEIGVLGHNCEINRQSVRKGEIEGEIEYIDIASVTVGHLDSVARYDFDDAPSRARRRIRHGDTLWSCVRPNRRSFLFIHNPPSSRLASTGFAVLSPGRFGPAFLYSLVTRPEFVDYLVANADGSAYPAVRADHFAVAPVVVPDAAAVEAFDRAAMPLRDLIAANDAEAMTLAETRDALLPKLLSGEVRVAALEGVA